jgi:hypothetical protein
VLKVKVAKTSGHPLIAAAEAVAPANLLFSSLFKGVRFSNAGFMTGNKRIAGEGTVFSLISRPLAGLFHHDIRDNVNVSIKFILNDDMFASQATSNATPNAELCRSDSMSGLRALRQVLSRCTDSWLPSMTGIASR